MFSWFYWFVYYLTTFVSWFLFPYSIRGLEHLPRQGPCILASNHESYLDPVVLGSAVPRRISFMAKESLFAHPVLGWILRHLDAFPVKRGEADIGALRQALRRLKAGQPVLLFPEGTRSGEPQSRPQAGVGFLVAKGRVPVIPISVTGTDAVLPPGAKWFRRHPITVTFGPPLTFSDKKSYEDIAAGIMAAIQDNQ